MLSVANSFSAVEVESTLSVCTSSVAALVVADLQLPNAVSKQEANTIKV